MKITFIGAGSLEFTTKLARDILTFPRLVDATISLMDIDAERLSFAEQAVGKIVRAGSYPAKVEATLDRTRALDGADVVLVTILSGSTEVWRHDIEIPMKYGVDINVGDTRGPAGIFRFLRTLPDMMNIVRDMERLCPDSVLLNYTNPMAMLVSAIQKQSHIRSVGLCHSVQGTAAMLADWIGAPYTEIDYRCAGINHLAWFLDFKWNGQDAYPLIRAAVSENQDIYNREQVRNEMFLALGYYVTESSGHNSEYNWWFRKRPDLVEKYCSHGTNWNPGEHAYILKEYQRKEAGWKDQVREELFRPLIDEDLRRGHEYAAYIINALAGGEPFRFNGNLENRGLIPNLPEGACVEVPIFADKDGFHPIYVGELPREVALLTGLSSGIEELAVKGALSGDREMIFKAIAHDPLTAAVLSLAEIRQMVDALFEQHRDFLPQFFDPS